MFSKEYGLRDYPEAIEAVYAQAQIQTCTVHLIRISLSLASWKDRKALESFTESKWGKQFPTVPAIWQR